MADKLPPTLLPPGTYWTAIAHYADRSGFLGAYGPYPTKAEAEDHAAKLRAAGVYEHETWLVLRLRSIDLGTFAVQGRAATGG